MRALVLLAALFALSVTGAAAPSEFWCWDADEIVALVEGDTVRIQHLAALYNCCPEPITYEVEVGDATILVTEHTEALCFCLCCTNLEMTLADVPAGPWNIVFRWDDMERGAWVEEVLQILVPDVGQRFAPSQAGKTYSGCLQATGLPESTDFGMTWGTVKTLFR